MNFQFPVYALRSYYSIEVEGDYKVISTFRNRYILDDAHPMLGTTYEQRRMRLLGEDTPYSLYPLNVRMETLSHVLMVRPKKMIDAYGTVLSLPKDAKFHKVVSEFIESKYQTPAGNVVFNVRGCPQPFTVRYFNYARYARYIKVGKLYLLFDLSEDKLPDTRVKL